MARSSRSIVRAGDRPTGFGNAMPDRSRRSFSRFFYAAQRNAGAAPPAPPPPLPVTRSQRDDEIKLWPDFTPPSSPRAPSFPFFRPSPFDRAFFFYREATVVAATRSSFLRFFPFLERDRPLHALVRLFLLHQFSCTLASSFSPTASVRSHTGV